MESRDPRGIVCVLGGLGATYITVQHYALPPDSFVAFLMGIGYIALIWGVLWLIENIIASWFSNLFK